MDGPDRIHAPQEDLKPQMDHTVRLESINGTVVLYIDDEQKTSTASMAHRIRVTEPVWASDPWHDSVSAQISNLEIYAP